MRRPFGPQFATAARAALDLLFPRLCVGCDHEGADLCRDCYTRICLISDNVCPLCARSMTSDTCHCMRALGFDHFLVAAPYHANPILQAALHQLKYGGQRLLAKPLAQLLVTPLRDAWAARLISSPLILIPLPLPKIRERRRGYNQSTLIARALMEHHFAPHRILWAPQLLTRRWRLPQVGLDAHLRALNMQNAFRVHGSLHGANVLLLDDVITTGSTISAAAHVLRAAGARRVFGIAVAKG